MKMDGKEYVKLLSEIAESDCPWYAFVERKSAKGTYITSYQEREVFLYLKDDTIYRISPNEEMVRIRLEEVKGIQLTTGAWDSEILCYIYSNSTKASISFGDHSYVKGGYNIAAVLRPQFREFVEVIHEYLVALDYSRRVIFEARGPSSRATSCLGAFLMFGLAPIVLSIGPFWWMNDLSQHEIERQVWPATCAAVIICFACLILSLRIQYYLSPGEEYAPSEFPENVFEFADRSITNKCQNKG